MFSLFPSDLVFIELRIRRLLVLCEVKHFSLSLLRCLLMSEHCTFVVQMQLNSSGTAGGWFYISNLHFLLLELLFYISILHHLLELTLF